MKKNKYIAPQTTAVVCAMAAQVIMVSGGGEDSGNINNNPLDNIIGG